MQAYSPISASTSTFQPQSFASTSSSANASLTIDPAALTGGGASSQASTSATTPQRPTASADLTTSSVSKFGLNGTPMSSSSVKQEPEEHHTYLSQPQVDTSQAQDAIKQSSISAAARSSKSPEGTERNRADPQDVKAIHSKSRTEGVFAPLVDQLLGKDHRAILRPDLSPFVDARDALRRLLPYHVWNIPHHDLLKALDLKEDPILNEVRLRKRRRVAKVATHGADRVESPAISTAVASSSLAKVETDDSQLQGGSDQPTSNTAAQDNDAELNELGLPVPLPDVPQPDFPPLDYTESVFARRRALASRFQRTLTRFDTTHKRAPNASLTLEHLERLAYNDDKEEVLAHIEELKELKGKLEELEESRQIDASESSAKISLSFGITDEIEREKERERELERIKRQQERAAAKAAKLEKEREARHRLGIFTPPPEPTNVPASNGKVSAASPARSSTATPAPSGHPGFPTSSLQPYSAGSTPASTPGGYPFPPGASWPSAAYGSSGFPMPSTSQIGAPSSHASTPGTPYGSAPPVASMPGATAPGVNGMPSLASAHIMPTSSSKPGTPSASAATPVKPPSKSKSKAAGVAAAAAASLPGSPGTPGTPGVTPGPTPHRGRGRPRKHPLPGTPGGPPIPTPRKKKEKVPAQPAAIGSTPGTPSAPGMAAMSPPLPPGGTTTGMQARPPPSASPVPPTMPGPAPGYSGEAFTSTLPPTPAQMRPLTGSPVTSPMMARPPTMHPTLISATSLNTPRAATPGKVSPSPGPAAAPKATTATANGTTSTPAASLPTPMPINAAPSIPTHPIPLLIPVASLPRLSALGIQPTPSPHIRPIIGPNGQPQGLEGLPIPIDPTQSVPAVLLGISEGTAEASGDGGGGKQQILHISVVLSKLSPSQLSGLAVIMQSLQAQVEAGQRK